MPATPTHADGLVTGPDGVPRCFWGAEPDEYRAYHDREWGMPVTGDHRLFEKICLEGFQAGLSWLTILRKREKLIGISFLAHPRPSHRSDRERGGAAIDWGDFSTEAFGISRRSQGFTWFRHGQVAIFR